MNRKKKAKCCGLVVALCFPLVFGTACSGGFSSAEALEVDSVEDYVVTVPQSTEDEEYMVQFECNFYRLYTGTDVYASQLPESGYYVVGEDAYLSGTNVEELDGAWIFVSELDLSDCSDYDSYCDEATNMVWNKLSQTTVLDLDYDTVEKKVKKYVSSYWKKTHILCMSLLVVDTISTDISVTELTIPELDLTYSFDRMEIQVVEVPENVVVDEGDHIAYTSGDGVFAYYFVGRVGYLWIEGEATSNLYQLSAESLNEICEVVTTDNQSQYSEYDVYGESPKDYLIGDTLDAEFAYVFAKSTTELLDVDTQMASLLLRAQLEDGQEMWSFHYISSILDGDYLLMKGFELE